MISTIILAIIQGVSEFLPISSSAHLIIFRDLFLIGKDVITEDIALTFDIALHFGTLLAIILYFFKDFWDMFINGITKGYKDEKGKLLYYLIIATIPAAMVGFLFEDIIDGYIRNNFIVIAIALIVMGLIIYFVDKKMKEEKEIKNITLKEAFLIGCSQIFALIPGFSRSGTTITTGRLLKLNREDSAKFSFYLSLPIISGAVLLQLIKMDINILINHYKIFIVGIVFSFLIGLLCIKFLLNYVKKKDFSIFMWYRLALGLIVLIKVIIK